jgi:hypothetical protein
MLSARHIIASLVPPQAQGNPLVLAQGVGALPSSYAAVYRSLMPLALGCFFIVGHSSWVVRQAERGEQL